MTYACEKCIHRYPLGGCLVPSNLGYVEQCKHFTEEPKPQEMTNEEWFCSLPTERKAYFFAERFGGSADRFNDIKDSMLRWLKEIH